MNKTSKRNIPMNKTSKMVLVAWLFMALFLLNSCMITMNMTHAEGIDSGDIDDTQSQTPDITTDLTATIPSGVI